MSLAQRFNGEILNSDAMQLYSGLPIITNKLPVAEQRGIPHHLLGCIPLSSQPWTVTAYVRAALAEISSIRARGRLPILVGGTHYYIQALLFEEKLVSASSQDTPESEQGTVPEESPDSPSQTSLYPILSRPTEEIHAALRAVDSQMADRWHPQDRRKIQRSLHIYLSTGLTASAVYASQSPSSLRFDTLILWPHANSTALTARLDTRVDNMLDAGLVDEVRELASHSTEQDVTKGIYVAIGYKEFLHARTDEEILDAMEGTKAATRRYAKRQVRWIRRKLLPDVRGKAEVYVLDGSERERFAEKVEGPAEEVVGKWLNGEQMPDPVEVGGELARMLEDAGSEEEEGEWRTKICEVCGTVCTTRSDWRQHEGSRKHKLLVRKKKKEVEGRQGHEQHSDENQKRTDGDRGK